MDVAERNRELQATRKTLAEVAAGRQKVELLLARIRELGNRS
jgi:hypothetical protein